jgi:arsenate reductase
MSQTTIYGIANCDKVRKARKWFAEQDIDAAFHDFRKDGLDPGLLSYWLESADWNSLLNRAGTTWRKLPETRRDAITSEASALALMLEMPTVIKRPVIEHRGALRIGFDPEHYA